MKTIYFKCKKCFYEVYTNEIKKFYKLPEADCPECGEEGFENWIVLGVKK